MISEDINSYTFQTVGYKLIPTIAKCLDQPLYQRSTNGKSIDCYKQEYSDINKDDDEITDLKNQQDEVKQKENIEYVCSGAILSDYQRQRIEYVTENLGLQSIAPLWQRDGIEQYEEMIRNNINAIIIKTATLGLNQKYLGKTLQEMSNILKKLYNEYKSHICGEGGEYETLVLDCPLYKERIVIDSIKFSIDNDKYIEYEYKDDYNNHYKPTYLHIQDYHTIPKLYNEYEDIKFSLNNELLYEKKYFNNILNCSNNTVIDIKKYIINENNIQINIPGEIYKQNSLETNVKNFLNKLQSYNNYELIHINIGVYDMNKFGNINKIFSEILKTYPPPSRACIELPIASLRNSKDIDQYNWIYGDAILIKKEEIRKILHVKSQSRWIPPNIGFYSQAVKCYDQIFVSGQIGLKPECMEISLDINNQISQIAKNLKKISEYYNIILPTAQIYIQIFIQEDMIIKYHKDNCIDKFLKEINVLSYKDFICPTQYICVPQQPRKSLVEVQVIFGDTTLYRQNIDDKIMNIEIIEDGDIAIILYGIKKHKFITLESNILIHKNIVQRKGFSWQSSIGREVSQNIQNKCKLYTNTTVKGIPWYRCLFNVEICNFEFYNATSLQHEWLRDDLFGQPTIIPTKSMILQYQSLLTKNIDDKLLSNFSLYNSFCFFSLALGIVQ